MAIKLTDAAIISLLSEPKALPSDYQARLQLRAKTGHKERELETKGYDPLADIKKGAADRWVRAVNSDASYGKWAYEMVRQVSEVNAAVTKAAGTVV